MVNVDKLYHMIASLLLYAVGGLTFAVVGAIAKEVYDYFSDEHTCDPMDAIATMVPALVLNAYAVPYFIWSI